MAGQKIKQGDLWVDSRTRLNNQDLWLDGKWIGHLWSSGSKWYGALPGQFFTGGSQTEVAQQVVAAFDSGKAQTDDKTPEQTAPSADEKQIDDGA